MSQGQELALREATQSAVAQLQDDAFAQQVKLAVPEGVAPRQLLRAAATAVLENAALAKPELRASLLQATLKCAQDGLLPDGRDAAFVIYRTRQGEKVQYQPMIGGLRRIAADHGWSIVTAVVHENDSFDPDMDEGRSNFKPTPLGQDRGAPIGAYAAAQHRDGMRMLEVMTLEDIEKRRQSSKAKDAGPWVDWWETMAEKTVGKRLFKKLSFDPKDRRIAGVLRALEDESVDALYGPAASDGRGHNGQRGAAAHAATPAAPQDRPEQQDVEEAEWTDAAAGAADEGAKQEPASEAAGLNEPSDEELAALGAGDVTAVDTIRFDVGKFKGKTFAEIHAEGDVGVGYLKWALREWVEGPLKEALREFAVAHPELVEDE